jgi:peroxiredoxin
MTPIRISFTVALLLQTCFAQERRAAPLSDFVLSDMDGRPVHYNALKGNVTVAIFFSTRCPMSNAFNYRRNTLYLEWKDRVNFIMIDSNSNESVAEIRDYARAVEFDFPVYRDIDHQATDALGAQITTDTFVLDASGTIRYHGYLEDSPNPTRAKHRGLRLAIESVVSGAPVTAPETKAFGCAIRRAKL